MAIRLNKIIILVSIALLLISCKDDAKKRTINAHDTEKITSENHFFDKKYFQGYLMSVDESTHAEHPFFSYLDCEKEGYFSVHFIPKTEKLISFWRDKYFEENKYEYDDLKTENRIVNQLLNGKYNLYNIFCIQVTKNFLDTSNGCTEESINLKNDAKANIFLYNYNTKQWDFQENTKINTLPPYADNEFFFNRLPSVRILASDENIDLQKNNSLENNKVIDVEDIFRTDDDKLIIEENVLIEILNKSNVDQGKSASLLNSYILKLLLKRKNKEKISFTDEKLFKIIAYTIDTTDPIYYKYFDSKGVYWGKYSFGDSKGGASLSEALILSKLLSEEDIDNMTTQFKENNYYNLKNLKEMLKKTSWFE
ncbi:hypothetical protein [Chryseobacterium vrystaatense]|uniref:Uncharacterized protein n=1 Tax=Chryseobacterium vrystaatense TaxID=307480 RepID=A0A1M5G8H9_9FLAO|nr:hypothetical protein [Chryseobacterium vrystaatense]SHF99751.1 hypothetical protein SAMN02787073_3262 [Chryseobacterium vrystaatense]